MLGLVEPPGPLHPAAAGDAAPAGDGDPALVVDVRSRSLGFGNAVHAALEWSARAGWARPDDERLANLLASEGLDDDAELARARAMVDGWLGSPLAAELAGAETRAEVPFALELGEAIVRGQIDLLVRAAGPPASGQLELLGEPSVEGDVVSTVVDFKTDALGEDGPAALGDRYANQRELYALALASAGGGAPEAARVRAVHVFLEAPDRAGRARPSTRPASPPPASGSRR